MLYRPGDSNQHRQINIYKARRDDVALSRDKADACLMTEPGCQRSSAETQFGLHVGADSFSMTFVTLTAPVPSAFTLKMWLIVPSTRWKTSCLPSGDQ